MKLITRIALRLSLSLLPLMALWAAVFYYAMIDQVNDDTDDVLEKYSEMIIMRMLSDHPLPEKRDGNNNSYTLTRVSEDYASKQTGYVFRDAEVYIAEQQEWEPARLLTTIFRSGDGAYYELIVSMPTFEKTDLLASILQWVVYLYAMLLLIVLGMTTWVFNRSLGPVYRLCCNGWTDIPRWPERGASRSILDRRVPAALCRCPSRPETFGGGFRAAKAVHRQRLAHELPERRWPCFGHAWTGWTMPRWEKEAVGHVVSMRRTLNHAIAVEQDLAVARQDRQQPVRGLRAGGPWRVCRRQVALCGLFEGRGCTPGCACRAFYCVDERNAGRGACLQSGAQRLYPSACGAALSTYIRRVRRSWWRTTESGGWTATGSSSASTRAPNGRARPDWVSRWSGRVQLLRPACGNTTGTDGTASRIVRLSVPPDLRFVQRTENKNNEPITGPSCPAFFPKQPDMSEKPRKQTPVCFWPHDRDKGQVRRCGEEALCGHDTFRAGHDMRALCGVAIYLLSASSPPGSAPCPLRHRCRKHRCGAVELRESVPDSRPPHTASTGRPSKHAGTAPASNTTFRRSPVSSVSTARRRPTSCAHFPDIPVLRETGDGGG